MKNEEKEVIDPNKEEPTLDNITQFIPSKSIQKLDEERKDEEQTIRNELQQIFLDELKADKYDNNKDLSQKLIELVEEKLSLLLSDENLKWDILKKSTEKYFYDKTDFDKAEIDELTKDHWKLLRNVEFERRKANFDEYLASRMSLLKDANKKTVIVDYFEQETMDLCIDGVRRQLEQRFKEWCNKLLD
jgi:hypothetical protein